MILWEHLHLKKKLLFIIAALLIAILLLLYLWGRYSGYIYPPMNISPFLFHTRTLKYPMGSDALVYWGDGRYEIAMLYFADNAHPRTHTWIDEETQEWKSEKQTGTQVIMNGVKKFRYVKGYIYVLGDEGYLIVDVKNGTHAVYHNLASVPVAHRNEVDALNDKYNIRNHEIIRSHKGLKVK